MLAYKAPVCQKTSEAWVKSMYMTKSWFKTKKKMEIKGIFTISN